MLAAVLRKLGNLSVAVRPAFQKGRKARAFRRMKKFVRRPLLHNVPTFHKDHPIRHLGGKAHFVGHYEHARRAGLPG